MDITAIEVSHPVGPDCNATALRAARARSSSIGAMEEMSGKVQNMLALTLCNAKVMSTRTTAGQFKSQFKGAMEELSRQRQKASTHISLR